MNFLFKIINDFSGYNVTVLYILTGLSVISGILMVVTKNPVVSVLYLMSLFANMSLYLIFMGIVFIGMSYLLVYVGAVSMLFLFMLMLMNMSVSELMSDTHNNMPLALMVTLSFFMPMDNMLPSSNNKLDNYESMDSLDTQIPYVCSNHWDNSMLDVTDITSMGNVMYTTHFIWLIITSMMLLLAMVGSMIVTMKQKNV